MLSKATNVLHGESFSFEATLAHCCDPKLSAHSMFFNVNNDIVNKIRSELVILLHKNKPVSALSWTNYAMETLLINYFKHIFCYFMTDIFADTNVSVDNLI